MNSIPRIAVAALCVLAASRAPAAERLSIAAAANLVYALAPLNAEFAKADPDVVLTSETGASGSLVVQIENGAPYDVFLSADLDFPRELIAAGGAEAASLTTFALGRLVLWTTAPELRPASVAAAVRSPGVRRIAIANPATAPYGRAAKQAIEKLGLMDAARPKLVVGENVSQAAQYVESGNADAGFVALSLVLSPKLKDRGRWLEVPDSLFAPIEQGAVLTHRGADNAAARRYIRFLAGPAARGVLRRFGYGLP